MFINYTDLIQEALAEVDDCAKKKEELDFRAKLKEFDYKNDKQMPHKSRSMAIYPSDNPPIRRKNPVKRSDLY